MSKKKRRKRKYRKANIYRGENNHHILWIRSCWAKGQWSNKLRSHPAMIVTMDANKHRHIHESMRKIPVPRETSCEMAYNAIQTLWEHGAINENTPINIRLDVLICLFDYIEQDTANALKEQLRIVRDLV